MKRWILLLLFSAVLYAEPPYSYDLRPVAVSDRIFCFFGEAAAMDRHNNGNMVNSCFVQMPQGWLVIDSGPTYLYAEQAYAAMQMIDDLPVRIVINTHVHDDHWLGNGFYAARGATIVGPGRFAGVDTGAKTRMERRILPRAFAKTIPILPRVQLDRERTFVFGNETVSINVVEYKAHTEQDLFVYIPTMGALFAGDLVFNDRLPSLRDGDINGWIAVLKQIRSMRPMILVGGHGRRTDADALTFTYDYLVALRKAVRGAIDGGVGIDDAVKTITMPRYAKAGMYDLLQRQNVETAYRTLEWED